MIKDVSAMTKEKTALVIPNAIQICTGNDKLFFCSFTVRDKAHMTLFKVSPFLRKYIRCSFAYLWYTHNFQKPDESLFFKDIGTKSGPPILRV